MRNKLYPSLNERCCSLIQEWFIITPDLKKKPKKKINKFIFPQIDNNILLDTYVESESVSIISSGFLFRSPHFRSSFFAHCLSLISSHSRVFFSIVSDNVILIF
jgi:hypothetical protein